MFDTGIPSQARPVARDKAMQGAVINGGGVWSAYVCVSLSLVFPDGGGFDGEFGVFGEM